MGFNDWASERKTTEKGRRRQDAEDEIRFRNAARVVETLTSELVTVIPHLAAFPSVEIQEQRVDLSFTATRETVLFAETQNRVAVGEIHMTTSPLGAPRRAWPVKNPQPVKNMWLDEDGHLWFAVDVSASGGLERPSTQSRSATASTTVFVPLRSRGVQRWVQRDWKGLAYVYLEGRPVSSMLDAVDVAGTRVGVQQSESAEPRFFKREVSFNTNADLLHDDPSDVFVGFRNHDLADIDVRDLIFNAVKAALQQGRRTL